MAGGRVKPSADRGAVSTRSCPKVAVHRHGFAAEGVAVSTHSHPKVAGKTEKPQEQPKVACFNTQPPEGSWKSANVPLAANGCFNTQPPEGSWFYWVGQVLAVLNVSTHSRLKAAGIGGVFIPHLPVVSTHSRLKAAGYATESANRIITVSTHSRLKAAGGIAGCFENGEECFNTQPPKGGWKTRRKAETAVGRFNTQPPKGGWADNGDNAVVFVRVSTHSRLKAAGFSQPSSSALSQTVSTHSRLKAAGASLKSLAPSGFAAPISLGSQEKREREYNTAFSVTPAFTIS